MYISGDGPMPNYADSSDQPWNSDRGSITEVVILGGVTSIGSSAFSVCSSLTGALTFTFESAADDETTLDLFKGVEADGKAVPEKDSSGKATRNGQTQGKGDTSKAAATETIEDEDAPLAAGINCMLVAGLSAAALLALCAVAVYVVRRRRA